MLIPLDHVSLADNLCVHLRRAGFEAERAGGSMVEVQRPDARNAEHERREAELHLRIWSATNPGARGQVSPLLAASYAAGGITLEAAPMAERRPSVVAPAATSTSIHVTASASRE